MPKQPVSTSLMTLKFPFTFINLPPKKYWPAIILPLLLVLLAINGDLIYVSLTVPSIKPVLQDGILPRQTSQILASDQSPILTYGISQKARTPLDDISPVFMDMYDKINTPQFFKQLNNDQNTANLPIPRRNTLAENPDFFIKPESQTQRMVNLLLGSQKKSLNGWLRQSMLAHQLASQISPRRMKEVYLSNADFGNGTHGIESASQLYFAKAPRDLSTTESAFLISLLQQPQPGDPIAHPDIAKKRRDQLVQDFSRAGYLEQDMEALLERLPLFLNPDARQQIWQNKAPLFNRYIMDEVLSRLQMDEQTFWRKGYQIQTTLDPRAQGIADREMGIWGDYRNRAANIDMGLLSFDPTGKIIALSGSNPTDVPISPSPLSSLTMGGFPNKGTVIKPYMLAKIIDKNGKTIFIQSVSDRSPEKLSKSSHRPEKTDGPIASLGVTTYVGRSPGMTTVVWVGNGSGSNFHDIADASLPMSIWQAYTTLLSEKPQKQPFTIAKTPYDSTIPFFSRQIESPPPVIKNTTHAERKGYNRARRKTAYTYPKRHRTMTLAAKIPTLDRPVPHVREETLVYDPYIIHPKAHEVPYTSIVVEPADRPRRPGLLHGLWQRMHSHSKPAKEAADTNILTPDP